MTTNAHEGELSIQSPQITSTVPSPVYMRRLNYFNVHQRRPLRPSLEPLLWNPNQENRHSRSYPRSVLNLPSSLNAINNGPSTGIRAIKSPQRLVELSGNSGDSTRRPFIIVGAIFFTSVVALFYIYLIFPELEPHEMRHIKIPWDIEDAKQLGRVLDRYKDQYFIEVLLAVVVTYILYPFPYSFRTHMLQTVRKDILFSRGVANRWG